MQYYEVWVGSSKYHGDSPLTYSCAPQLKAGAVVIVPLQRSRAHGIVLRRVSKPSFKTRAITEIASDAILPDELIQLIQWLREYYPAPLGQLVTLLVPGSPLGKPNKPQAEKPGTAAEPSRLPLLTKEQGDVLKNIKENKADKIILHGNTGSGKTRVYLELAKETLARGKSVILLTPEIGLTPQLEIACSAAFPGKVVVLHSDLTPARRRDIWFRILESTEPRIVIGARSALFSPLKNIGLIVVDEFHENSYKQDQSPHYQTTRVAAKLAELHKAQLVLGSATPPISDYFIFQQKQLPILRMKSQAISRNLDQPNPTIIDLKDRAQFQTSPWVSDSLLSGVQKALERNEQSLVFLNRRGTARIIMCTQCGWQAMCPHCDLSLTYHGDNHTVLCHTCGYKENTPTSCPKCSANDIIFRAIGTKALAGELERLFPHARIRRFDSDVNKREKLEQHYTAIRNGEIDILVGTQMLAKGLDLPKLSVLGIAQADTSLTFPDYTAEERTFQLLTQVLGRVNRGHTRGNIYIQTYRPNHPLLEAAITQNYEGFLSLQLAERQLYAFPPFRFTLKLLCSRSKPETAQKASQELAERLQSSSRNIEVIGPSPSFVEKVQNRYRWQIVIKSKNRQELIDIIRHLPANWSYDIDPINLL